MSILMRRSIPMILLMVALALSCAGCARTRTVEYAMTWSGSVDDGRVVLTFGEFPNHYVDIVSPELHAYLRGREGEHVDVTFRITTRLGCLERLEEVRIDGREDWPKVWAGSGWVGSETPSPWDELHCLVPWWG